MKLENENYVVDIEGLLILRSNRELDNTHARIGYDYTISYL